MLHLLRKKTRFIIQASLLFLGFIAGTLTHAQEREMNLYDHDTKPYYFGISLGYNSARFHTEMNSRFLQDDSVYVAEPLNSGGFSLGLSATARLSDRFQLRINPQLMFFERSIFYNLKYPDEGTTDVTKTVESVSFSFPLDVKLQSDRIHNFRVYMLAGVKGEIDMASNARAKRAEDLIKINKYDFGVQYGIGFNIFFKSFILSPEVKLSNGLSNIHSRDAGLKYSSVFDKINSRMILFTLHIEG
jgi:hypothetical protein